MDEQLEASLIVNIKGALGMNLGHKDVVEAKRLLRVVLYTLKREGFAISRVAAPGHMMPVIDEQAIRVGA